MNIEERVKNLEDTMWKLFDWFERIETIPNLHNLVYITPELWKEFYNIKDQLSQLRSDDSDLENVSR